jgi:release factor glutamine methyltransferase
MITILESIKLSTLYLSRKGIESPRANAEMLLADIIGCKRLELYLSFERPLSKAELNEYRVHIKRRGNFEPLQYITSKVEFYGLELKVNPSVLIPRPETELLVENILKQYIKDQKQLILDIGCGSGNISIALAVNLPEAEILATDISDDALKLARENSVKHNVPERIKFINHDILKNNLENFPVFDAIVSNPPYVSKENFHSLQKEIREFEPASAVTDYRDGYSFFREIAAKAPAMLKENGKLFFEMAQGQSSEVQNIMNKNNFSDIMAIKDYQNIDRIIYGVKK